MPVSLAAARGPVTVCTGTQREPAQSQLHSPSQNHTQFTCPLCPREKTYQGTAASIAAQQREVHPGERNSFLEKLGKPLQKTSRSNRYGTYYKCGDLHANFCRHLSGCYRTPPETVPSHSDGQGGESSARRVLCEKPGHALDPCSGKFQPKRTVFIEQTFAVGNRICGPQRNIIL